MNPRYPNCSLCDDGGAVLCDGIDNKTGLRGVYAYQCTCNAGLSRQPMLPPVRLS